MAKAISQETFNDVVRENMEEFEMVEEEAIIEAVQQFEAQGVNLSNIIRSPSKTLLIKTTTERLVKFADQETILEEEEEAKGVLQEFTAVVKEEISHKLLAASMGVYAALIKILKQNSTDLKHGSLVALTALMDGYPDLLDPEGVDLILWSLQDDSAIAEVTLQWIQACVKKHETNRSSLIRKNVSKYLGNLSEKFNDDGKIICGVCEAIQVLILDDDVRVIHGNAHEHARSLATELLPLLTSTLPKFLSDANVTKSLLDALGSLLIRNEFCITFNENNGVKFVLDAMISLADDEKVARSAFLVLKNLAGSDEVREPIIAAGGGPIVVDTLEKHFKNNNVAIAGCMCIGALTLRSPSNSLQIATAGGPETLVRCLEHWKTNKSIMKHGCSAIRNQVSRCTELREQYRNLQLGDLLAEAKKLHGDLGFEAKSVLLDLGCEIKLNEEWKGTGKTLES